MRKCHMNAVVRQITYEIDVQPGEILALPPALANAVGAGKWVVTIEPATTDQIPVRNHDAFLKSYEATDEGLYDDLASR